MKNKVISKLLYREKEIFLHVSLSDRIKRNRILGVRIQLIFPFRPIDSVGHIKSCLARRPVVRDIHPQRLTRLSLKTSLNWKDSLM